MKTLIHSLRRLVALLLLTSISLSAAAMRVIDVRNPADLTQSGAYLSITSPVRLQADLRLGKGSVLAFEGGVIDLAGHTLTFADNAIQAADCRIFVNATDRSLRGNVLNSSASAAWFGPLTGSQDPAAAVNLALAAFATPVPVEIGAAVYRLQSPIAMTRQGASLRCAGELVVTGDFPAIELSSQFQTVDVNIISNGRPADSPGAYVGTGISFNGNVYNGKINVRRMSGLGKGFDFTARRVGGVDYSGYQYNKISWMTLDCQYGIYIDLYTNVNGGVLKSSWFNENQFNGGRMRGVYGVYAVSGTPTKGIDRMNGNVYRNLAFDNLSRTPVTYSHFMNERFENLSVLGTAGTWISLTDGSFSNIDFLTPPSYNAVAAEKGVDRVQVSGYFTGAGSGVQFDRMWILNSKESGTQRLLTSTLQGRNVANSLTVRRDRDLTFRDLLATLPGGDTDGGQLYIASDLCELDVAAGCSVTIDFTDAARILPTGMRLRVKTAPDARVSLTADGRTVTDITESTLCRIAYTPDGRVEAVPL